MARISLLSLVLLALAGCVSTPSPPENNVVVFPGDTVWLLSRERERTECAVGVLACRSGIGKYDRLLCSCQ